MTKTTTAVRVDGLANKKHDQNTFQCLRGPSRADLQTKLQNNILHTNFTISTNVRKRNGISINDDLS